MTNLTLKPILSEAWDKVAGVKRYFFVTFLALVAIQLVLLLIQVLIHDFVTTSTAVKIVFNALSLFICIPLVAGVFMLGVKQAKAESINYKSGFAYFKKIVPLFLTQIFILVSQWIIMFGLSFLAIGTVLVADGFSRVLFIASVVILGLVFIVLVLCLQALFSFAFILVADQGCSAWQAYKRSIRMAFPHLKILLAAQILFVLFDVVAAIPVGIGLLWSMPFSCIATGVFYREISKLHSKK